MENLRIRRLGSSLCAVRGRAMAFDLAECEKKGDDGEVDQERAPYTAHSQNCSGERKKWYRMLSLRLIFDSVHQIKCIYI